MTKFDDFLAEQLQDPEIKAEYDALAPEFALMQRRLDARNTIATPPANPTDDHH